MTSQFIPVEPFDCVVFGGTGDLAERKLLPALYHRQRDRQLSEPTRIIGASRSPMSHEEYRAYAKAALGLFKFDFDNPFAVYLHDTPTKGTFDQFARNASHGCVRLEHAQVLAEALLAADPVWAPEKIEEQLELGKTVRVPLQQKVPVFIFYWTAFAGPDGSMNFRADPYDWDRLLLQKVGVLETTI